MDKQQPSALFGLNFLQDIKDVPDEIPGAYDHEQERWIVPGQMRYDLPGVKDDLVNYLVNYLEQKRAG